VAEDRLRWSRWLILAIAGLAVLAALALWRRSERSRTEAIDATAGSDQRVVLPSPGLPDSTSPATPEQAEAAALICEAMNEATRLAKRFPQRVGAHHSLAVAHYELGRFTEAEQCWNRVLQLEPNESEAYRWLAYVAMDRGEYSQAAELYRKLVALDPSSEDGRFGLAEACINLGELDTARRLLQQDALPDRRESAPAFLLLGQICLELRQYDQAKKHYLIAARWMPRAPQPHFGLATACAKLGETEQAAEHRQLFRKLSEAERRARGTARGVRADLADVRGKASRILTTVGETYAAFGEMQEVERLRQRVVEIERIRRQNGGQHVPP
jgi:tetratricopeptide (TPR) repeat protein